MSTKQYHVSGVDSLAALSTNLELEKGDKMGRRRAKEFSESLRKTCRMVANNKWLVCCTNQIRQGDYGEVTPGGEAFPFYASLRLRIGKSKKGWQIERIAKVFGKEQKKVIGVRSSVYVAKSSLDDAYRSCDIFIVFGYGVHDIMTNLQYLKDTRGDTMYICPDGKGIQTIEKAASWIETHSMEAALRKEVIEVWNEVQRAFDKQRKPKVRF